MFEKLFFYRKTFEKQKPKHEHVFYFDFVEIPNAKGPGDMNSLKIF